MEASVNAVIKLLEGLLEAHPGHFLVDIRVKPTNNLKVFIDGDEGIQLNALIEYNRKLYRQIVEAGIYPDGEFSLEVSSPGVDEPLKLHRQYKKNVGRFLELTFLDGAKKEGKLLDATEDGIVLEWEEGKGKKKETKQETFLFDQIKSAVVQVRF